MISLHHMIFFPLLGEARKLKRRIFQSLRTLKIALATLVFIVQS